MKITRRQLRQLIQEGLWDSIKSGYQKAKDVAGDVFDISTQEDLKEWGTDDAVALFEAMKGLGTDEDKVKEILSKRIDDLDVLYKEFGILLQKFIGHIKDVDYLSVDGAHRIASIVGTFGGTSLRRSLDLLEANHDLIAWLHDDGMEEESELVQAALDAKGIPRDRPAY